MTSRIAATALGVLTGSVLALGIYIATDQGVPTSTIAQPLPRATITITKTLPQATKTITEDDARWNCKTMGNKRCGKVVARGNRYPKVCQGVPQSMMRDCISLSKKRAHWGEEGGTRFFVPAGEVRVRECRADYSGLELSDCLRQP